MIKNLINLLFPKLCLGCESLLRNNEPVICAACRHDLPFTNHLTVKDNETFKKFYGRLPVHHASSIVYFHKKGLVQELIHKLKYKGAQEIGTYFGQLYGSELTTLQSAETFDTIIPVPLHAKKHHERGYNQVTSFGQALSELIGIPLNENLLIRNRYSNTQTQKNLLGRTEINTNLFDVTFSEKDHNKHFLLIDDVITSGSTLEACGKALLKIPGAKLSIVTIAFAHS
ncbi:amidophosphoribosyltransferase [Flavobacterium cauense R2A-7]|uniref:ComF family protein n=1 Tax=Flavobacterium cauense R2A-7 TaxID=1341154 RepID=V6S603_9FLAO|nr:ComF family protein [Flavobacterium cauense]ESU21849.1 amidophosphoribosyltransferase [Flavobacterium cauense R2A-7]KGO81079.1 amidophosphoribosyltransferase [Flavobacterium cauense R2A-7]TWI12995.1 ComF family protein [Flavobacterium cauense R2A-7]